MTASHPCRIGSKVTAARPVNYKHSAPVAINIRQLLQFPIGIFSTTNGRVSLFFDLMTKKLANFVF